MSVSTNSTDPVQTIYDLLNDASTISGGYGLSYGYLYGGAETWTNTSPEVYFRWEVSQQDREHNNDDALYLWSPDSSDRTGIGAEHKHRDETQFVDVSVWTLQEQNTLDLADDVLSLLEEYATDNLERTQWVRIWPSSDNDLRAENIVRKTDHYVITVSVDLRRIASTGMV